MFIKVTNQITIFDKINQVIRSKNYRRLLKINYSKKFSRYSKINYINQLNLCKIFFN